MAITPLKALLFASGGIVVVGGTAYVSGALDPYFNTMPPAEVASQAPSAGEASREAPSTEAMASNSPADSGTGNTPGSGTMASADKPADGTQPRTQSMASANPEAGTAPAGAEPPSAAAAGVLPPTFDVVRVEGNGSIVVAGNAAPKAKVEIVNGATVLGSTTSDGDGSFAIVLDEPLKPGDYTIVLRSTTPDNVVANSTQTAVVSVPETSSGQVLALVEEPGKPSELITLPKPDNKRRATGSATTAQATPPADSAPATAVPTAPVAGPRVVVEAVEIDGKKVFVAGIADPGRKVRAYANEILLGDAQTSPDGHFLVEATRELPVGDYIIHVDALDSDGAKVLARAAVPFQREPGESMAAVAPSESGAEPAGSAANDAAAGVPPAPAVSGSATTEAPASVAGASSSGTETAQTPSAGGPASGDAASKPAESSAAQAPSAEQPAAATEPGKVGEQSKPQVAAGVPKAGTAPEVTGPALEHAEGAVVIRRHDTLWQISRRLYGHGTRYSTIYLANQDQIKNPDMIWPGQVFKVPATSKEGEAADMKAMGNQMTAAPAKTQ